MATVEYIVNWIVRGQPHTIVETDIDEAIAHYEGLRQGAGVTAVRVVNAETGWLIRRFVARPSRGARGDRIRAARLTA